MASGSINCRSVCWALAIATVIYPLVSRHAARGDLDQLSEDLTLGLRLVGSRLLPAGVGIILVAHPLVKLLFERGEFTADDTARSRPHDCFATPAAVGLLRAAGAGAGLLRGRQSRGAREIGARGRGVEFCSQCHLDLAAGENGLALSTAIAAGVQVALLAVVFSRTACALLWKDMGTTLAKSVIACAIMSLAVTAILRFIVPAAESTRIEQVYSLALAIGGGVAVYFVTAWAFGMSELRLLFVRPKTSRDM